MVDTPVYCTAEDVANFLQVSAFDESSTPTETQVKALIVDNEDWIDTETMHSWKTKTVTKEYHHLDLESRFHYNEVQIHLRNRSIKTFDSGEDDKLEVWNGSSWEDYLTSKTEGRASDFWVNYEDGIIFLKTSKKFREFSVRVTYRFGDTIKRDIKKACIYLTAIDILNSDDRTNLLPEGTQNVSYDTKINKWQEKADKIIASNKEFKVL